MGDWGALAPSELWNFPDSRLGIASTGPRCHGNSPAAARPKAPAGRPTCEHSSAGATYRDGVFLAVLFAW